MQSDVNTNAASPLLYARHFKNQLLTFAAILFSTAFLFGQSAPQSPAMVLETQMSAPVVNNVQIKPFQLRAQQKLTDFTDIVSLVSDNSFDLEMRKEMARSAVDLFYKNNVEINWYFIKERKNTVLPLEQFLDKIISENKKIKVVAQEITDDMPANCAAPQCAWRLYFIVSQTNENGKPYISKASMNVILKMEKKNFGSVEKEFWKVFLGEIKEAYIRP